MGFEGIEALSTSPPGLSISQEYEGLTNHQTRTPHENASLIPIALLALLAPAALFAQGELTLEGGLCPACAGEPCLPTAACGPDQKLHDMFVEVGEEGPPATCDDLATPLRKGIAQIAALANDHACISLTPAVMLALLHPQQETQLTMKRRSCPHRNSRRLPPRNARRHRHRPGRRNHPRQPGRPGHSAYHPRRCHRSHLDRPWRNRARGRLLPDCS